MCEECFGPNVDQCSICVDGYYLFGESTCVSKCPYGRYTSVVSKRCMACDQKCETCDGLYETDCTLCLKGLYYNPFTKLCIKECSTDFIQDEKTRKCIFIGDNFKCYPTCSECY